MFLDRNGYLEETFFTFSLSPVRDESEVGGLFHPVTELTAQTIAERRLNVLRDVADRTADGGSVEEAARILSQTFESSTLDLPFVLLYLVDADGHEARLVENTGVPTGAPMNCRAFSKDSTASRKRDRGVMKERELALRWCASWSGCTVVK
jgi:hypothetical protein